VLWFWHAWVQCSTHVNLLVVHEFQVLHVQIWAGVEGQNCWSLFACLNKGKHKKVNIRKTNFSMLIPTRKNCHVYVVKLLRISSNYLQVLHEVCHHVLPFPSMVWPHRWPLGYVCFGCGCQKNCCELWKNYFGLWAIRKLKTVWLETVVKLYGAIERSNFGIMSSSHSLKFDLVFYHIFPDFFEYLKHSN
jgi:hypothetical protein